MKKNKFKIGFIGQGWIGKNYADDFENRGFNVVRYSMEEPYVKNRNKIRDCDIVFIAVPTPSTPRGFDFGIVKEVVKLVGKGKVAVIKSTMLPGSTSLIQKVNPEIFVMHSPEFLSEATAAYEASHPDRNIVGIPKNTKEYVAKAEMVMSVLPMAPYRKICDAKEAELVKYGGNCFFYTKVIFMNIVYDLAKELNCDWEVVRDMMIADSRIGSVHMNPVHKGGRGCGGHCFVKDFVAFMQIYKKLLPNDKKGLAVLSANEKKNIELMVSTKKDLDLLLGVYGKEVLSKV